MDDLKPCPFCGSYPIRGKGGLDVIGNYFVTYRCPNKDEVPENYEHRNLGGFAHSYSGRSIEEAYSYAARGWNRAVNNILKRRRLED